MLSLLVLAGACGQPAVPGCFALDACALPHPRCIAPARCTLQGQTIACMYLGLTCFIQLSIMLTRNPSFWWHFSKKRCGGRGIRAGLLEPCRMLAGQLTLISA